MTREIVMVPTSEGRRLGRQLLTFAAIGGVGLVLDVGIFNLLTMTVLSAHVPGGPLVAKAISTTVAIAANWIGNRTLTFRSERRPDAAREAVEFALVSLAGSAISLACLWLTHYGLGFTSRLADNVSANVIGLLAGSAFRFVAYRSWVFRGRATTVEPSPAATVQTE
jgi:putative flippase GtrA